MTKREDQDWLTSLFSLSSHIERTLPETRPVRPAVVKRLPLVGIVLAAAAVSGATTASIILEATPTT